MENTKNCHHHCRRCCHCCRRCKNQCELSSKLLPGLFIVDDQKCSAYCFHFASSIKVRLVCCGKHSQLSLSLSLLSSLSIWSVIKITSRSFHRGQSKVFSLLPAVVVYHLASATLVRSLSLIWKHSSLTSFCRRHCRHCGHCHRCHRCRWYNHSDLSSKVFPGVNCPSKWSINYPASVHRWDSRTKLAVKNNLPTTQHLLIVDIAQNILLSQWYNDILLSKEWISSDFLFRSSTSEISRQMC